MNTQPDPNHEIVVLLNHRKTDDVLETHRAGCADIDKKLRRNATIWSTHPAGTDAMTILKQSPIEDWASDNGMTIERYCKGKPHTYLGVKACAHELIK